MKPFFFFLKFISHDPAPLELVLCVYLLLYATGMT